MAELSDDEIKKLRDMLKRDEIAKGALAYVRTGLVWLAAVIAAIAVVRGGLKDFGRWVIGQ